MRTECLEENVGLRTEVAGEWRRFRNEELFHLQDCYWTGYFADIIQKGHGCGIYQACETYTKNHNKYSPKNLLCFGNRDEGCASVTWIQRAQDKVKWLNLKKTVMILRRM